MEDSNFAKKAFADAVEKELDAEFEAFKRKERETDSLPPRTQSPSQWGLTTWRN